MKRIEVQRFQSFQVSFRWDLRRHRRRRRRRRDHVRQLRPFCMSSIVARSNHPPTYRTQEQRGDFPRFYLASRRLQVTPRRDEFVHPPGPNLETSVPQSLGLLSIPEHLFLDQPVLQGNIPRDGETAIRDL